MTNWLKQGVLIEPSSRASWAATHAAMPTPLAIDSMRAELFYSPRDSAGRAHVARAEIEVRADGTLNVLGVDADPVLSPGPLGAFDDSGVTVSCAVPSREGVLLYYTGWTRGVTVPFYFYAGLAIRPNGADSFERVSPAPILERTAVDPYLTASPWVLKIASTWQMWYVSCTGWDQDGDEPRHHYHIRYAESTDGIRWRRDGRISVDFADQHEYAFSRPCVVLDRGRYRMWFAARGHEYRLGYAESTDGLTWERDDSAAGLAASPDGWDSEMVAYPAVLDCGGRSYLLYNGNGYGRTGIGYAIGDGTG